MTGSLFFVPSSDLLEALGDAPEDTPADETTTPRPGLGDGSLGIGSLKGGSS